MISACAIWWMAYGCLLPAAPGDYGWPLGKEAAISGTFGEYREGHFHTGIDFSTDGQTGRPVYAVSDAEVYRVADSLTGFGKAIYLKHRDGNRSVYAHLDKFAGGIHAFVARKRRGMKFREKLDTTVDPGEIPPVKRGELIGYSGESGAGLPHLHFELRRDEETPIHPFDFLPRPTDSTPPKFLSLNFYPVREDEKDPPVIGKGSGRFMIAKTLTGWPPVPEDYVVSDGVEFLNRLTGKYWVDLAVTDISEYAPVYRLSPRKIVYALDRQDTKTILFDRLSYALQENKKVGLIYDLGNTGGMYHFRLFTGLPRPRAPSADPTAILNASIMSADTHRLWIRVEDMNGNFTDTEFRFVTSQPSEDDMKAPRWTKWHLHTFYPSKGKSQTLTSPDKAVSCHLEPSMFYSGEAVMIWAGAGSMDTPLSPKIEKSMPPESTLKVRIACLLEPLGMPLAAPATLRFTAPAATAVPLDKIAVFRTSQVYSKTAKWSWVGSIPDSAARTVSAQIDRLALYVLSDDSVVPSLSFAAGRTFSRNDEIHVTASDRGSGIADTGSVEVDGKPHEEWYYDSDRGWVRVILSSLKQGRHRLAVTMADRLGNITRKEWSFRVR